MKNAGYTIIGDYLISAWGEVTLSSDEEQEMLAFFKTLDLERIRCLVFTKGAAPTAMMRKHMHDALGGREMMAAIVTDVYFMRGIVTTMSWFNKQVRAFPSSALESALRYLEIPPDQYELFRRESVKLQAAVAVRSARRR